MCAPWQICLLENLLASSWNRPFSQQRTIHKSMRPTSFSLEITRVGCQISVRVLKLHGYILITEILEGARNFCEFFIVLSISIFVVAFLRPISQYQRIYIEFFCPFKACYSFALSTFFFLYSLRYIFVEPSAVFHDARYKKTRVCCLLHFSLTAIGRGIRHEYHSGGEHNLSVRVEYVPFVRELYLIRYPTLMTLPDRMR